ncbi:MAG: GNAT family N-acetyltransferase [Betaproteobacteria bacterium]
MPYLCANLSRPRVGLPFAEVCLVRGSIVGLITSKLPRLISLLIVDPMSQRQGIGSRLIERKRAHVTAAAPEISIVEVNATEYSLPFYRRHGFYPISEFIEFDGCRFVRLGYWRMNPLLKGANRARSRSGRNLTARRV